ncbi:MAG: hypothetical protein MJE77_25330 [Proteobacteria bacterium]|nr:hypothetical protein [Pseudomonadota bacterium]
MSQAQNREPELGIVGEVADSEQIRRADDNTSQKLVGENLRRYRILLDLIHHERLVILRLDQSFLAANLALSIGVVLILLSFPADLEIIAKPKESNPMARTFLLLLLTMGMGLCTYWTAQSLRLQMRLKLRYFQTRAVERAMGNPNTNLLSDEATFFNKHELVASDGLEKMLYPDSLDGFMGHLRMRAWSWFLPCMFFVSYFYAAVYLLVEL